MIQSKLIAGSAGLLLGITSIVFAQTAATSGSGLEEVVVTAEKRSENVQDIPKQVQVVSIEQLQNENITSLTDLRKLVPSFSYIAGAVSPLALRGVATAATTISANSKVGVVLDDIPIPSRASGVNNLLDIDHVEVLPGPQGTLAGRNATGGLINIVTRKPSRDHFTAVVQGSATTDKEYIGGLYLSGPLSDQFAYSLSTNYQYYRGLKYNVRNGQWDADKNVGFRAKMLWSPNEDATLTATYSYYFDDLQGTTAVTRDQVFAYIGVPLTSIVSSLDVESPKRNFTQLFPGENPGPDNRGYYSLFTERLHRINNTIVLRYEQNFAAGTLTAIGSAMKEKYPQLQDTNNYTLVDMNIRPEYDGYAHVYNYTDYKTLELRFASKTDQPWTYLAGAFFSDNVNRYDYARYYQPVNWHREFGQSNGAAFGSTSYRFSSGTTLRGGLRYEKDHINYLWVFNTIPAVTRITENGTVLNFPASAYRLSQNHASGDYVNYDLGLQQQLGDDVMAYVTFGHANQGPIYDAEDNTVAIVRDLTPVPSEKVNSLEVGVKSQWLDRRLTVNADVFESRYDNYQASTNVPDPNNPNSIPVLKLWAVGKVITRGVELNTQALIAHDFRLDVAALYNDAYIQKWLNAPCYPLQSAQYGCITGIPPGELVARPYQPDLSGNTLNYAPKYKVVATGTYSHALGLLADVDYRAALTARYTGSQNTSLLHDPASDLAAVTYIDADLAFTKGHYELAFFGSNLFAASSEAFSTQLEPGIAWNAAQTLPAGYALVSGTPARGASGAWPIQARVFDRNNDRYFGVRLRASF